MRDSFYSQAHWPKPTKLAFIYQDLEWLQQPEQMTSEDVVLPEGYSMNPDETEDSAIQGPPRDPVLELWEELTTRVLTEEDIEKFRKQKAAGE